MPHVIYTQDNAISSFFSEAGASSSKIQCDEFARRRYGGEIRPVDIQGLTSYTIITGPSGNKIIQFRERTALLDMNMLALAKDIHQDVVASCSELGWIGDLSSSQLAIYEMDRLPGENYITARPSLTRDQRLNTVCSLASFFAQSWQRGTPADSGLVDMSVISAECYARFNGLAGTLPERFLPAINEVQAVLPALLDGRYPVVLTHSDLNEMNIMVDPCSGNITGVVDWPGASIQPFGFTLYALENALGRMGSDGWKWFDNVDDLKDAFWRAFEERTGLSEPQTRLVKLAGKAGILIRYGTAYNSGFSGMIGVRDPNTEDFRYLDALLL
ncbi:Uu.00g134950.m01.CDS01 [Anthostomella pinea]|uniref:Uu.00g134950.m01.CDS01 n=1 Tax=Anthostomella pinea TaxID=933095 RepID=A0AAI8VIL7_9PEZI|nr:Uu.00g134950.m01.CDS01 [Anthostomella pinea]